MDFKVFYPRFSGKPMPLRSVDHPRVSLPIWMIDGKNHTATKPEMSFCSMVYRPKGM
jgi:uncharacterized Zn-finger protein